MGMIVHVYKNPLGDCTSDGVSKNVSEMCVVNCEGPFQPNENCPAVMLDSHMKGILRLVPAIETDEGWFKPDKWFMDGGNLAATSDSRFTKACERLSGVPFYGAVCIHDRDEV